MGSSNEIGLGHTGQTNALQGSDGVAPALWFQLGERWNTKARAAPKSDPPGASGDNPPKFENDRRIRGKGSFEPGDTIASEHSF